MLRLTELTLPIHHAPDALAPAIQKRLRLPDGDLLDFTVFKRSYDARKKSAELCFVYTIDCELRDEAAGGDHRARGLRRGGGARQV